jgi:hypothetical protein
MKEKTVNTDAVIGQAPRPAPSPLALRFSELRMTRLSHPRANLLAVLLLAAVFLIFGLIASAALEPSYTPAPSTAEGSMLLIGNWLLGS